MCNTIVEIADDHDAATIVMGSRGLTGLRPLPTLSMRLLEHVGWLERPAVCDSRREAADGRAARDMRSHAHGTAIATLLAHARDAIVGAGAATAMLVREAYG